MHFLEESLIELITQTATNLPPDVRQAMGWAIESEAPGTQAAQALGIIANNIDTISSDAANSVSGETGAAGGGDAGKSHGGIVSVFPVGEGPANEKAAADTSPVLGGGNSDLWSGGEEAPAVECPVGPSGKVSCEARP